MALLPALAVECAELLTYRYLYERSMVTPVLSTRREGSTAGDRPQKTIRTVHKKPRPLGQFACRSVDFWTPGLCLILRAWLYVDISDTLVKASFYF